MSSVLDKSRVVTTGVSRWLCELLELLAWTEDMDTGHRLLALL